MPISPNNSTTTPKRPVPKKTEKSPVGAQKAPSAEVKTNKPSVPQPDKEAERLDLNISSSGGSRRVAQGTPKKPNIDSLAATKLKDNRRLSSRFKVSSFREIQELASFREAAANEREPLLIEKLRQCCVLFDFSDPLSDVRQKEIKRKALIEIQDYLSANTGVLTDPVCKELVCMVGVNIFRSLPPPLCQNGPDPDGEEEEPLMEPSWPHLQHVYEVFLRFIESTDFSSTIAKQHIDQNFIIYAMDLFDSEDSRERDYLKTILHRIYGKMISLRAFIRKQINHIFYRMMYEDDSFKGSAELLEILGSIINGFQVPLKEEHKTFLEKVLLPLHKVRTLGSFQPQLSYCITEFIRKDITLLKLTLEKGLLWYWPKTQSLKEIMFLNEMDECLELSDAESFRPLAKPVFSRLAKCISSPHFQVCERALLFWNNDALHQLFVKHIDIILPTTFPALYQAKQHWNKTIHGLVYNSLKIMMDINQKLFDECTVKFREDKMRDIDTQRRRQEWWNTAQTLAKSHPLYGKFASETDEVWPTKNSLDIGKPIDMDRSLNEMGLKPQTAPETLLAEAKKTRRAEPNSKPNSSKLSKSYRN